ncbi:MAG TPA: LysR substrate-binding domain-containing protein [Pseudonocardiaceae bacterium]
MTPLDRTGTNLADFADTPWIGGCARCRAHLLACCAAAGFTPTIAFTTDDYVAVQSLVAAGVAVATLPGLAINAARNDSVRTTRIPGASRHVFALAYGEPPDPPATTALLAALRDTAGQTWPDTDSPATGSHPMKTDRHADRDGAILDREHRAAVRACVQLAVELVAVVVDAHDVREGQKMAVPLESGAGHADAAEADGLPGIDRLRRAAAPGQDLLQFRRFAPPP